MKFLHFINKVIHQFLKNKQKNLQNKAQNYYLSKL